MKYNFQEHGLEIIRNAIPEDEIELALKDLDTFYSKGNGSRVVNLHMDSANILNIISKPAIYDWIEKNCFKNPMIYTTLTFQKGTQQPIHRDSPHFLTWPKNHFIGVWYALEDVTLDNGCLRYLVGGHKIDDRCGRAMAKMLYPDKKRLDNAEIDNCMNTYQLEVMELCEDAGCEVEQAVMKKGDVLIWHALLPHGGSPIKDISLTRKSIVAHCVPVDTRVYNARHFFNPEFEGEHLPKHPITCLQLPTKWWLQKQPPAFFQEKYV